MKNVSVRSMGNHSSFLSLCEGGVRGSVWHIGVFVSQSRDEYFLCRLTPLSPGCVLIKLHIAMETILMLQSAPETTVNRERTERKCHFTYSLQFSLFFFLHLNVTEKRKRTHSVHSASCRVSHLYCVKGNESLLTVNHTSSFCQTCTLS